MTVEELINKLKVMPLDLQVKVEGCDCYRWAHSPIVIGKEKSVVLITSKDD